MNNNSRTKNSILNILTTISYQILTIFGSFILRTIFIEKLSAEYLGISGLFSNILSVLSLTELGIGNAIIFSMYKPLKEKDENKLSALVTYYKKIYMFIGIIVLILGICVIPFLPFILNLNTEIPNVIFYYLLYLMNSVVSYFMIYKTTIVRADQKEYILRKYDILFTILKIVLQLISLIIYSSYLMYLLIQILLSILQNYIMSKASEKMYPYIKKEIPISINDKKNIWDNIKSLFMYQIGSVALNNTDNIIISIIVSTITVGIYSNYSMIISALSTFSSLIFTAIIYSIGNYNVKSSENEKKFIFDVLEMLSFWIYGFCSICLMILMQDFIKMWLGNDFLFLESTLIIIVLNYYITGVLYPIFCFRNTTNLFKTTKYIMFIAALINIVLSIILGKFYGLNGILIATAISRILTNIWYEPYVLFRDYFKSPVYKYYLKKILECLVIIIIYFITLNLCNFISIDNVLLNFVAKMCICIFVINIIYILILFNRSEFKFLVNKFLIIIKSK